MLDFGSEGSLATDLKVLLGARHFDSANIFCKPDLSFTADPDRSQRGRAIVTREGRLERLLLKFLASCGPSTAILLENGEGSPPGLLRIAAMSIAEFDQ